MSSVRHDPELAVPRLSRPVPRLRADDPELALAGQAGEGRLLLEGERGAARLEERGGVVSLHLEGILVAGDLSVDAGVMVNLVASPGLVRRERVVGGASLEETVVLPPRLPLLALQLREAGAGAPSRPAPGRRGSLVLLPDAPGLRWRADGAALAARADGPGGLRVVVCLSPDDGTGALEAEPAPGGGLTVRFTLPTAEAATLLVGAATDEGPDPLLAAPHLAGHARMAMSPPRDGLALATGVGRVDGGVGWARMRLATAAHRGAPALRPWAVFWSGLGALAGGDEAAAHSFLEALADSTDPDGGPAGPDAGREPHPLALPPEPLPLLLAARHALALGDAGPALREAARVDHRALEAGALPPDQALLWSLALHTLADALRWSAGEDEAQRYRTLARTVGDVPMAPPAGPTAGSAADGAGLRLPMVGEGPGPTHPGDGRPTAGRRGQPGSAAVLRALLRRSGDGDGGGRPDTPDAALPSGGVAPALAPWATLASGRAVEGWTLWRAALDQGLDAGPQGRGSWDPWRPDPEAPGAGLILAALVHGLLGWEPDAPVGRTRLAPRFPPHLTGFEIRGLRVGSVTMALEYRRDGGVRRYLLEPTGGRAPATVILEPTLDASGLATARVDGEVVELDPRPGPGGLVVPLQIPLDAPRTVELVGRDDGSSGGSPSQEGGSYSSSM